MKFWQVYLTAKAKKATFAFIWGISVCQEKCNSQNQLVWLVSNKKAVSNIFVSCLMNWAPHQVEGWSSLTNILSTEALKKHKLHSLTSWLAQTLTYWWGRPEGGWGGHWVMERVEFLFPSFKTTRMAISGKKAWFKGKKKSVHWVAGWKSRKSHLVENRNPFSSKDYLTAFRKSCKHFHCVHLTSLSPLPPWLYSFFYPSWEISAGHLYPTLFS